jgi:hypothetical protein
MRAATSARMLFASGTETEVLGTPLTGPLGAITGCAADGTGAGIAAWALLADRWERSDPWRTRFVCSARARCTLSCCDETRVGATLAELDGWIVRAG